MLKSKFALIKLIISFFLDVKSLERVEFIANKQQILGSKWVQAYYCMAYFME